MKPFDLNEAKAGKPVCTRNGDKARIICTDLIGQEHLIIVAVYEPKSNIECVIPYTREGKYSEGDVSEFDLFMAEDEKPQHCGDVCLDGRFEIIEKAKQHLLENTNIHTSPDEMKVLDAFLFRCWQMGWLKDFECKEENINEKLKCSFKPFDKVLVRNYDALMWDCEFFCRYASDRSTSHPFYGLNNIYAQCIPYNEETAHLLGTTDAPPEKYVIW